MITQRVDPEDPALGATVAKLRALAAHVDELVVLTLVARPVDLPANVRVKEFGANGQLLRGARLVGLLVPELRRRPVAVLAHMSPIYAVLAAPVTRPLRVPLLLWFTHWRQSRTLRLAERLATKILSVSDQSFPLPSRKVVATGHGIEVPGERPAPRADDGTLQARLARAHVAGQGARDRDRGSAAPRRRPGRSRAARAVADGRRGDASAGARSADRRARARGPRSAGRARARNPPHRRSTHGATCSSTTCAPARSTRSSMKRPRPGCPSSSRARGSSRSSAASTRRSASRRTTRRTSPTRLRALHEAGPERRRDDRRRAARADRARPFGRALGGARGRGGAMTQVLHVQKVSGVSGSEAHLLSLLPLLRQRGWDARMVVLHEGEPGAREFISRMLRPRRSRRGVAHALRSRSDGGRRGSRADGRTSSTRISSTVTCSACRREPSPGCRCG